MSKTYKDILGVQLDFVYSIIMDIEGKFSSGEVRGYSDIIPILHHVNDFNANVDYMERDNVIRVNYGEVYGYIEFVPRHSDGCLRVRNLWFSMAEVGLVGASHENLKKELSEVSEEDLRNGEYFLCYEDIFCHQDIEYSKEYEKLSGEVVRFSC